MSLIDAPLESMSWPERVNINFVLSSVCSGQMLQYSSLWLAILGVLFHYIVCLTIYKATFTDLHMFANVGALLYSVYSTLVSQHVNRHVWTQ